MPWTSAIRDIIASFSQSEEAKAIYSILSDPVNGDAGAFVDGVYQNLFNRLPDDAGKAYWVAELEQNRTNPHYIGSFILAVMNAAGSIPEAHPDYDLSQKDFQVLYNKTRTSDYYAIFHIKYDIQWFINENYTFAKDIKTDVNKEEYTFYESVIKVDSLKYDNLKPINPTIEMPMNRQGIVRGDVVINTYIDNESNILSNRASFFSGDDVNGHTLMLGFYIPGVSLFKSQSPSFFF